MLTENEQTCWKLDTVNDENKMIKQVIIAMFTVNE